MTNWADTPGNMIPKVAMERMLDAPVQRRQQIFVREQFVAPEPDITYPVTNISEEQWEVMGPLTGAAAAAEFTQALAAAADYSHRSNDATIRTWVLTEVTGGG